MTLRIAAAFLLALTTSALSEDIATPPLQLAQPAAKLSMTARVLVSEFRFTGNTVFPSAELGKVTAPWRGREVSVEELEDARRAVTLHYVAHGYINSGAVLPEQDLKDGVITMRIVEGALSDVDVTGNKWLRTGFITDRLHRWAGQPLNMNALRDGLQLLRQDPNVARINAELRPGTTPGESRLDVRVEDRQPFQVGLQFDNERPPSVGSGEVLLLVGDRNLTGHSDALDVTYGIAEGGMKGFEFSDLNNVSASYALPVTRYDTTLRVFGSRNDFAVIEEPFDVLDISSESYRVGGTLRQPVYQTADRELALSVTFERRHSQTRLLGLPFDITPGSVNGVTDLSVLRFAQEWTARSLDQVVAMRSTFSFGINAFGVTDDGTNRDAKFWAWLGQFQYVRRLFNTANQLIVRTDVQWTDEPLLSLEQFTLGGANSVRGCRENQLVRDHGVFSSIELRLPVLLRKTGTPVVQIAPFFDFGGGWNTGSPTPGPQTIYSAGVGLLLTPNPHVNAQLYWGHRFQKIVLPHDDPQDDGLHFRITLETF